MTAPRLEPEDPFAALIPTARTPAAAAAPEGDDPFASLIPSASLPPLARPGLMASDRTRIAPPSERRPGGKTVAMGIGEGVFNTLIRGPIDMARAVGDAVFGGLSAEELDHPMHRARAYSLGHTPQQIDALVAAARQREATEGLPPSPAAKAGHLLTGMVTAPVELAKEIGRVEGAGERARAITEFVGVAGPLAYGGVRGGQRVRRAVTERAEARAARRNALAVDDITRVERSLEPDPPLPERPPSATGPSADPFAEVTPSPSAGAAQPSAALPETPVTPPRAGRRRPIEAMSDADLRAYHHELFDRIQTRKGFGWTRFDPNVQEQRSNSGGGLSGYLHERDSAILDRVLADLERRGISADDVWNEYLAQLDERAEREGITAEVGSSGFDVDELGRPGQRGTGRARHPFVRRETGERDLLGEAVTEEVPTQPSLLEASAGTAASRTLEGAERTASGDLGALRERFQRETDPVQRQALASAIAERERLVNRDRAIGPDEMAARAAADPFESLAPAGQGELLTPAAERRPSVRERLLQRTAKADDVRSLDTIARGLAASLGVPLRQGRFNAASRGALGIFKVRPEVTRVLRKDDLSTVAHEIGHYLSKRRLRNPANRGAGARGATPIPVPALMELRAMGKQLYGSRKPAGGYGEEGIAEFFSRYVTDPARLEAEAPNALAHFESILATEPELRAVLLGAREDFARYQAAPASQRVAAMISVNERSRSRPTWRAIQQEVFDDLNEFRAAVEDMGGESTPAKNAYILARLTKGVAGAADEMLERGVVGYGTATRGAPSPAEAIRSIPAPRLQAFREYLVAESAIEQHSHGIDPGIALADALEVASGGRAEFQTAAEALWAHGQALIDYRRDVGLLTEGEAAAIKARNQRRVAFYRVFEADEAPHHAARGPMGRNSSGVMRREGSTRRIIDPLESVIRDTHQTVAQARRHEVVSRLVEMARTTEGAGNVIEQVPAPQVAVSIPLEKIRDQLRELGIDPDVVNAEGEMAQGILTAFEDAKVPGRDEIKDMVVPVIRNGQREWYAIRDRQLYDALAGLQPVEMNLAMRILSLPARTLRAGATLTAEFMGRNPLRDAWSAAVYSQAPFRPPFYRLAEGMFHVARGDELFQRWKLSGGDNAAQLGLDRPTHQRSLDQLRAGHARKLWTVVRHPIDTLRLVSSFMENASRVGEYAAVERQALSRGATPEEAMVEGGFAAREVTQDFAMLGTKTRALNQIIAFFGAQVGGSAKLVREVRARPGVIVPRLVATITVPSIALYLSQKDDPYYRSRVPRWVKDVSWVVVDRGDDRGTGWDGYGSGKVERVWTIPKPFEIGVLFGTAPERILEWIEDQDPAALAELAEAIRRAVVPTPIPTALEPVIENYADRSLFTGRAIVPPSRKRLDPAEQYSPYTSETARTLGRAMEYSPAKIDNVARGYGGGLARYATEGLDMAIRGVRGEPVVAPNPDPDPFRRVPGVKAFVMRDPRGNSEAVDRLYEAYEEAERHRQTWRRMRQEGRHLEARTYLTQHRDAIRSVATADENGGSAGRLRSAEAAMARLRNVLRGIDQSRPADAEARKQRIYQIMQRIAEGATLAPAGLP